MNANMNDQTLIHWKKTQIYLEQQNVKHTGIKLVSSRNKSEKRGTPSGATTARPDRIWNRSRTQRSQRPSQPSYDNNRRGWRICIKTIWIQMDIQNQHSKHIQNEHSQNKTAHDYTTQDWTHLLFTERVELFFVIHCQASRRLDGFQNQLVDFQRGQRRAPVQRLGILVVLCAPNQVKVVHKSKYEREKTRLLKNLYTNWNESSKSEHFRTSSDLRKKRLRLWGNESIWRGNKGNRAAKRWEIRWMISNVNTITFNPTLWYHCLKLTLTRRDLPRRHWLCSFALDAISLSWQRSITEIHPKGQIAIHILQYLNLNLQNKNSDKFKSNGFKYYTSDSEGKNLGTNFRTFTARKFAYDTTIRQSHYDTLSRYICCISSKWGASILRRHFYFSRHLSRSLQTFEILIVARWHKLKAAGSNDCIENFCSNEQIPQRVCEQRCWRWLWKCVMLHTRHRW